MNILQKSCIAIKDGVFFEKTYRYLFVRMKIYRIFAFLFSRSKIDEKKVVFVNYYGAGYGDNPKAIADFILENGLEYNLVWLLDKRKDDGSCFPDQIRKVSYFSLKSIYELATARIWVDNCRKEYFPKKKKGQIYIQTWHGGFSLKKIEADAPSLSQQYITMAKEDSKNIDVILNGYEFMTGIFKESFWYSGPVLNIGTPRSDLFFNKKKIFNSRSKVFNYYEIDTGTKLFLYAPTFRQSYDLDVYTLNYEKIQKALERKFNGKWKILVRLHPNLLNLADSLVLSETVVNVTGYKDMQELLCASDLVVTDYSSLVFDFFILNRPVFLYCPDLSEYTSKDRELYFDVTELPFSISGDNEELCDKIQSFDCTDYLKSIEEFKERVGFCEKGTACSSLFNWINQCPSK